MHNTKKRKHRANDAHSRRDYRAHNLEGDYASRTQETKSDLFVQAHEADLRRGPQAQELARSLEVVEHIDAADPHRPTTKKRIGSALIQCGFAPSGSSFPEEEEIISLGSPKNTKPKHSNKDESGVWVDRYDARLLLDILPEFASLSGPSAPDSPSGWSDLPSDTEDTFFFTPGEAKDYRDDKRRRLLEKAHEERVKARLEQDGETVQEMIDEDPWGGSDEEPDDAQRELMRRTAVHLLSSPSPAQLEMRILANHGADKRFAFLRGRWSRSWRLIKVKARAEKEEKETKEKEKQHQGLGLLAGYDSDSEEGSDHKETPAEGEHEGNEQGEEAKKESRRLKAKEWARQRRHTTTESVS